MKALLFLPFLHVPLERDEGAYGYIAQRILAGELPYRDAFDHKPPLVYYVYASFIKFFGNSIEAIRIPTLVYSLATTAAIFYLGFLLFGARGGLVSALLFAVFSGGPLIQGSSSNTETFMILPLILALIFFLKGKKMDYFWAGLFSGIAVMFKQVAIFNFLVLFGFLVFRRVKLHNELPACRQGRRGIKRFCGFQSAVPREVFYLIAGFLFVPFFFATYFWLKGALPNYIYSVFLVNRQYLQAIPFGLWDRMLHGVYTTFAIARLENAVLWALAVIGSVYIVARGRSRQSLVLFFWSLVSLLAVSASGLFFGHYYIQLVPGLCLLSAFSFKVIKERSGKLIKIVLFVPAILLIWPAVVYQLPYHFKYSPEEISIRQYGQDSYVTSYHLAQILKRELKPGEKVFVWAANPEFYFYLGQKAPTKYFNYLDWMETESIKMQIIKEITINEPDYIIWTKYAPNYQKLVRLVINDYRLIAQPGGWKVFKKVN